MIIPRVSPSIDFCYKSLSYIQHAFLQKTPSLLPPDTPHQPNNIPLPLAQSPVSRLRLQQRRHRPLRRILPLLLKHNRFPRPRRRTIADDSTPPIELPLPRPIGRSATEQLDELTPRCAGVRPRCLLRGECCRSGRVGGTKRCDSDHAGCRRWRALSGKKNCFFRDELKRVHSSRVICSTLIKSKWEKARDVINIFFASHS